MTSTTLTPNTRVVHRTHPEYGFGLVRYVEEDAFGEVRLQVAFDHLDGLENVAPDQLDVVGDPLVDAAAGRWGEIGAFRRKLAAGLIIGENNLNGGFTKAAVQPLPHQAFLLDKVLAADRFGHVLADDVGLGKTIEAGLLITCLMRREPPQRIMIVCPTGLAIQWQDEMDEHFGLPFSIMGENFDGKLAASWRTQPLVMAPLDWLKREEYRELLQQVGGFDLVVCDEAHRLTAQRRFLSQKLEKTANYRLFEFLVHSRLIRHVENSDQTPRSPRLLLLSATPHQGDDERFVYLLNVARPDLFKTDRKCVEQLTTSALVETLTRTPRSRAVDWEGKPLADNAVLIPRGELKPIIIRHGGSVIDAETPQGLVQADIAVVLSHGSRGLFRGFVGFDDVGKFTVEELAGWLGECKCVILFVCNAGRSDVRRFNNETFGLIERLLRKNVRAVIAPPAPIRFILPPIWLGPFLESIQQGRCIGLAHGTANAAVREQFSHPCAWGGLHLFGESNLAFKPVGQLEVGQVKTH